MADIVATIQAEQDAIIRSKPSGVLVVQGGPGTGKTAVALHRAAYLLYTHRDRLARRGVLVVGPNPTFLRYIGQVLPSLGETSVVLGTVGQLHPGPGRPARRAGRDRGGEGPGGDGGRDRRRRPGPAAGAAPADRAGGGAAAGAAGPRHRPRRPHPGPPLPQAAQRGQADLPQGGRPAARRAGGAHDHRSRRARPARRGRPGRHPRRAHREPRSSPASWTRCGPRCRPSSCSPTCSPTAGGWTRWPDGCRRPTASCCYRPGPAADVPADLRWTPADVPLLDEAAELLGDDGAEAAAREAAALREEVLYAQGVLDVLDLEEDLDPELLRATDIVDADRLAERQRVRRYDSTAERAAADREWTYGHVIVDEAQELSPMAWRLVMRRCPSRSMTIVGDIAQTGDRAGAGVVGRGARAVRRAAGGVWSSSRSTTARLRRSPTWPTTCSPRSSRASPRRVRCAAPVCRRAPCRAEPGRPGRHGGQGARRGDRRGRRRPHRGARARRPAGRAAGAAAGSRAVPTSPDGRADRVDLTAPVVVLPVSAAKGLEFDAVVVVEPAELLAESPARAPTTSTSRSPAPPSGSRWCTPRRCRRCCTSCRRSRTVAEAPPPAADLLAAVRRRCLVLPEVTEGLTHGGPTWFVRGRRSFVKFVDPDEHPQLDLRHVAVWAAAPPRGAAGAGRRRTGPLLRAALRRPRLGGHASRRRARWAGLGGGRRGHRRRLPAGRSQAARRPAGHAEQLNAGRSPTVLLQQHRDCLRLGHLTGCDQFEDGPLLGGWLESRCTH